MGKTRAKIDDYQGGFDKNWKRVLNLQGHGDAAFTGQGAAYEALTLCKLPKFAINGSIHFITNNQVGFTTDSKDARSFPFASDIVKPFGIPIIRVNAHDVESVARVSKLAVRYWQKFGKDVILDMIGFRKYGHNEVDEPAFTQPRMYEVIRSMKSVAQSYADKLIAEGSLKDTQYQKIVESTAAYFEEEFKEADKYKPSIDSFKDPKFKGSRTLTHKWSSMEFSQWG
jgi:2-oxoglutarate dehydrogenase complex dehydrogenase (E1) component-like enzyme